MSEFRQDLVSEDWIILAPSRRKRPHEFFLGKKKRKPAPKATCAFEDLEKSGNWPPILVYPNEKNWEVAVIPNKYPALVHNPLCPRPLRRGPYAAAEGSGHHDLVVTRDHQKNFAYLSLDEATQVLRMLQLRYRRLAKDSCLTYTSTFFNWGPTAGATLYHPHYQVLTLPVVPPDVEHSLRGSARYHRSHRKCVHCVMIRWERTYKNRIVDENAAAVSFAPFTPRAPFEIRVFPKKHLPYFEWTPERDLRGVAAVLRSTLRRLTERLNDPDFNFFIHTSPLKNQKRYRYYHWHIEITPKFQVPGGFELSTGMDINVVDPDEAAALLRGKRISPP